MLSIGDTYVSGSACGSYTCSLAVVLCVDGYEQGAYEPPKVAKERVTTAPSKYKLQFSRNLFLWN